MLFQPWLGAAKLPDLDPTPSAVCGSRVAFGGTGLASATWGFIDAFQFFPDGGPGACYRSLSSTTGTDTITWGSWQPVPNYASMIASASGYRITGAAISAFVANQAPANMQGQMVVSILPAGVATSPSTTILQIMNGTEVARSSTIFNTVGNGLWTPQSMRFDTYQTFATSGSLAANYGDTAPVFNILVTNLSANTINTQLFGCINYEVLLTNGNSTVLQDSPAVIDFEDLQRGVRMAANRDLVFFTDEVLMGEVGIGAMPSSIVADPNEAVSRVVGTTTYAGPEMQEGYMDRAESFSEQVARGTEQLGRIVGNSARTAAVIAPVLLAASAARSNSQPRLQ